MINKTQQYKSVKEVIRRGHIVVNVPVLIIMFGIPFLFFYLLSFFTPSAYTVVAFLLSIVLGFILGWTWWSFSIAKWRMWSIEHTHQDDWKELKNKAVKEKLIWPEGHHFEKTEIRNKIEKETIEAFYAKINNEEQAITLEHIEDDLSVPSETQYYFNRSELIFETVSSIFLLILGIFLLLSGNFFIGLMLTGLMLYTFDYKALKNINNRTVQLQMNKEGIEIDFLKYGLVKWSDTQDIFVDTEDKILTMIIWNDDNPFEITYSLKQLELNDCDEFLRILNIYMKRSYLKENDNSDQSSLEDPSY